MTRAKLIRLGAYLAIVAITIAALDRFIEEPLADDAYPGKPITIIIPFKPGGGSDRIARVLDAFAEAEFGRSLIFQYKSGGGGHLGIGYLAKSRGDGYMVATYNTPDLAIGPLTGAGQYKLEDLSVIGQVAFDPNVFAAPADTPFPDMKAFFDEARSRPGKLRLGIAQPKGGTHLSTLALLDQEAVDVSVILFSGGSELAAAVLGNQVDAGVSGLTPFLGSLEKVRFLATAGETRHPKIPQISTLKEQGIPASSGIGRVFLAPSSIKEHQLERLRSGFRSIFELEAFKRELSKIGYDPAWLDGKLVEANLQSFSKNASRLIRKYNL